MRDAAPICVPVSGNPLPVPAIVRGAVKVIALPEASVPVKASVC